MIFFSYMEEMGFHMHRFKRKALIGGFKLVKSGNHNHDNSWRIDNVNAKLKWNIFNRL